MIALSEISVRPPRSRHCRRGGGRCPRPACSPMQGGAGAAEGAVIIPPPAVDEPAGSGMETAIFAGGCFWGVQGVFQHVKGVESAVSGYSGGTLANPTYEQVSAENTGHAEAVKVTFDPKQVTYGKLLQIFFSVVADPTHAELPGQRSRHELPLGDLHDERRAEEGRRRLCRPARRRQGVSGQDRHRGDALHQLLPGRGLPSGLRHDLKVNPGYIAVLRPAEDRQPQGDFPGRLARPAGAGLRVERFLNADGAAGEGRRVAFP